MVNNFEQGFPPLGTFDPLEELQRLVDVCYAMGDFASVWSVEGLGLYHVKAFRARKMPVKNVLTDPALNSLPLKSMTMLHAGIGLSFGRSCLNGLMHSSPSADLRKALEEFILLVRDNSRRGYAACAFESLGLVSLILRYDTSPDDPYIKSLIEHRPDPRNQLLCRLWQRDIKEPCEMAIHMIHPVLSADHAIEEVFHYQSLTDLVLRLKGRK